MTDLYREAQDMIVRTHNKQIEKGLEKYNRPLDPKEWTVDQLAQHSFEEKADDLNYTMALVHKARALEQEVERLKRENEVMDNLLQKIVMTAKEEGFADRLYIPDSVLQD